MTWFAIVLPAVVLSYLGQARADPAHPARSTTSSFNPFFLLVPQRRARMPMVVLATLATIIASQAAITGSFSVARQAVQLGFLPRLKIVHTSRAGGADLRAADQLGAVRRRRDAGAGVQAAPTKLGDIYGVAVTGTFILNTILFLAVARACGTPPSGGWSDPRRRCS